MDGRKPTYIAQTKEDFEYLEKQIDVFLENYFLKIDPECGVAGTNVKKSLEGGVVIFPEAGKIEGIEPRPDAPKIRGILYRSFPGFTLLEIDKCRYEVRFNSEHS